MNHNLSNKKNYPFSHLWLTSNYINIYTQKIPIKSGDSVCISGKEYDVIASHEENVSHSIDKAHSNPERPYITNNTRFFTCKINREVQFSMTEDKGKSEFSEYRIPPISRNTLHANI